MVSNCTITQKAVRTAVVSDFTITQKAVLSLSTTLGHYVGYEYTKPKYANSMCRKCHYGPRVPLTANTYNKIRTRITYKYTHHTHTHTHTRTRARTETHTHTNTHHHTDTHAHAHTHTHTYIHTRSRGMPILAHNETIIFFKKQVIILYGIYS